MSSKIFKRMSSSPETARFRTSKNILIDILKKRLLLTRNPWAVQLRKTITGEEYLDVGKVTVIIPIHNVENYLQAALDSVRFQRYFNLQVILINDHSSDNSRDIAQKFVEKDKRFILIDSDGNGPGAARNQGLSIATGDYLCFVDSDDIVPIGGIYKLIESLSQSGSDFATGSYDHLHTDNRLTPQWVQQQHSVTKLSVSLEEEPGIVRNVFPWNKLFNKAFFDLHIGKFPENTFYEDQVPTALAYTRAKKFDVVSDCVYLWRRRATGDSITQNRNTVDHLMNRVDVLNKVWGIYREHSSLKVYAAWLKKSLFLDMLPFQELSDDTSNEYKSLLFSICEKIAVELSRIHTHEGQR